MKIPTSLGTAVHGLADKIGEQVKKLDVPNFTQLSSRLSAGLSRPPRQQTLPRTDKPLPSTPQLGVPDRQPRRHTHSNTPPAQQPPPLPPRPKLGDSMPTGTTLRFGPAPEYIPRRNKLAQQQAPQHTPPQTPPRTQTAPRDPRVIAHDARADLMLDPQRLRADEVKHRADSEAGIAHLRGELWQLEEAAKDNARQYAAYNPDRAVTYQRALRDLQVEIKQAREFLDKKETELSIASQTNAGGPPRAQLDAWAATLGIPKQDMLSRAQVESELKPTIPNYKFNPNGIQLLRGGLEDLKDAIESGFNKASGGDAQQLAAATAARDGLLAEVEQMRFRVTEDYIGLKMPRALAQDAARQKEQQTCGIDHKALTMAFVTANAGTAEGAGQVREALERMESDLSKQKRSFSLKFHPDRNHTDPEAAKEAMSRFTTAHESLTEHIRLARTVLDHEEQKRSGRFG